LVLGAAVVADGADGQNVVFGAAHLNAVAGLLYLRKRRRLSPERRQAEAARLAVFAFAKTPRPGAPERAPRRPGRSG
jgi:hypothetical protein